jgi:AcrR family transcriptional regulator
MGAIGAPAWHAILDGAEDILRDEGYAALNAKQIAERIGIKRQLVYYYFCDIDDLYVQLFHRIADRALDRLKTTLDSSYPLREIWNVGIDTFDQTLILEFMALANRNAKVRRAMLDYAEASRDLQVAALQKVLKGKSPPKVEMPFRALAFIATWVALGVQRESVLGINNGHEDVLCLLQNFLSRCEEPTSDTRD